MNSDDTVDTNALLVQALSKAAERDDTGRSVMGEFAATAHAMQWLQVMAVPRLFQSLKRAPNRDHLLMMVDIFIAYIRSGKQYSKAEYEGVPYERREPLALKLRALIETWPKSDSHQMAMSTRELLYCDGTIGPEGGWDNTADPDIPPDEYLLQPEDANHLLPYAERFTVTQ